jgi:hypothetical protein
LRDLPGWLLYRWGSTGAAQQGWSGGGQGWHICGMTSSGYSAQQD